VLFFVDNLLMKLYAVRSMVAIGNESSYLSIYTKI